MTDADDSDLRAFRDAVREFLYGELGGLNEAEASGSISDEVIGRLAALGYLEVVRSPARDGLGLAGGVILIEEVAARWGALALTLAPTLVFLAILDAAPSDVRERWTADLTQGRTRAAVVRCGLTVNGQRAGVGIAPRPGSGDAVVLEPTAWSVTSPWRVEAFRAADLVEVHDVDTTSGFELPGLWPRAQGTFQLLCAAIQSGLATGALGLAIQYARERRQFRRPIGSFGEIYEMLTDADARVAAAHSLVREVALAWDADTRSTVGPARAILVADQVAAQVTERAQHVFGGYGHMAEFEVGRFVRDAHLSASTIAGPVTRALAIDLGLPLPARVGDEVDG